MPSCVSAAIGGGLSARRARISSSLALARAGTRNAGGRSDTLGGFVEGSFKPSNELTLTAGGRLDRWSITGGFSQGNQPFRR